MLLCVFKMMHKIKNMKKMMHKIQNIRNYYCFTQKYKKKRKKSKTENGIICHFELIQCFALKL